MCAGFLTAETSSSSPSLPNYEFETHTIAGGQDCLHGLALLRSQPVRGHEGGRSAHSLESSDPAIDHGDHLPIAIEALARRDRLLRSEHLAGDLLEPKPAFDFFEDESAASMP